ncbi:GntR family transcriptional regulator [Nocardia niwae]|uniref:GntR family transcriptional regulator n=1 Tax=Nocardia niwae TaxID=626084 RepID=UPI0033CC9E52
MSTNPGRPRYLLIADSLRDQIARGDYAPGDQLPTKAALCSEWGAAVNTVERALQELRESGLIETFHGVGTFVRTEKAAEPERAEIAELRDRITRLEAQIAELYSKVGLSIPSARSEDSAPA